MWTIIITLIAVGLLIVLLEILVIPGGGVAGVVGFGLMVTGVYLAFDRQGVTAGLLVLGATVVVNIASLVLALRSKTWDRAMLKKQIDGKVNLIDVQNIKAGDVGKTISRCAPTGKAFINNDFVEVNAGTEFIDENQAIEVVRIEGNRILVKQKI